MSRSARRRRQARAATSPARPLRVLLVGRIGRRRFGGIGRSATMIAESLAAMGNVVRTRSVLEPLTDIPSDTDIVYHYGDYDLVEQQASAAREAGVPILINSTYDDRLDRRQWMEQLLDRIAYPRAYLVVFAEGVLDDPRMHKIADRLVAVPKTVRFGGGGLPFAERSGVCIGELEKLQRPRLIRGIVLEEAIATLTKALPGVKLYAFNQYGTTRTTIPAGIEVVAPGDDMLKWLGERRLYISLSRHETFSMVPAEAQGCGTPVLYRPMPQALTEQLGHTAYAFRDLEQLALGASMLYDQPSWWRSYSDTGRRNAKARAVGVIGAALDMALRKVVMSGQRGAGDIA